MATDLSQTEIYLTKCLKVILPAGQAGGIRSYLVIAWCSGKRNDLPGKPVAFEYVMPVFQQSPAGAGVWIIHFATRLPEAAEEVVA